MTGLHLPNAVRDTSCLFPWCKSPRLDEAIHRRLQVRTLVDDATPEVTLLLPPRDTNIVDICVLAMAMAALLRL